MKTIPTNFRKNGFDFSLLRRQGPIAIFQKSKPHFSSPSFEVVKIQSNPARTMAGNFIEAAEGLPYSESWGRLGFTCTTLERANQKFDELQDAHSL